MAESRGTMFEIGGLHPAGRSAGSGNPSSGSCEHPAGSYSYDGPIIQQECSRETIDTIYIDGQFVAPHGRELLALIDPVTEQAAGTVILADAIDAQRAILAARAVWPAFSRTMRAQCMDWLPRTAQDGDPPAVHRRLFRAPPLKDARQLRRHPMETQS